MYLAHALGSGGGFPLILAQCPILHYWDTNEQSDKIVTLSVLSFWGQKK